MKTYNMIIRQYKEIYVPITANNENEANDLAYDYACNLDWSNIDHDYEIKEDK